MDKFNKDAEKPDPAKVKLEGLQKVSDDYSDKKVTKWTEQTVPLLTPLLHMVTMSIFKKRRRRQP